MNKQITHRKLCIRGAKFIRSKKAGVHMAQYAVCELERIGESPDVFGFGGCTTHLLEIKVSRSDFLSDKNKHWRKFPEFGLGALRSYLCPKGLIGINELPEHWGLFSIDDKSVITCEKRPEIQKANRHEEIQLIVSIFRRENIRPQVFSYKKYKNESEKV